MTVIEDVHDVHGATYREVGGRRVVDHYGRPERVVRAVRNVVGVIEMGYGVVTVTGEDRVDFVDNAVSNRVPAADGEGCYALLLDPQGAIETEMYVYNAGERLLIFTAPDCAEPLVEDWQGKTFIQDVGSTSPRTSSRSSASTAPRRRRRSPASSTARPRRNGTSPLSAGRWSTPASPSSGDGLAGEEGYEVVCTADVASDVFDTLENRGVNAAPSATAPGRRSPSKPGRRCSTPNSRAESPNVLGLRNAVDFEKGCFVGQEVVSRVENRGQPSTRLIGLTCDAEPDSGAAVFAGDAAVGEVTRAVESPTREAPITFAAVDYDLPDDPLTVRVDGEEVAAERTALPFVEGSDESARVPRYAD